MTEKNIVLIGFMGSGKTSVGKRLSIKLKREFVDMDDFIVQKLGMTVNEIFEKFGEQYFRDIENELCERFATKKNKIIATGGGVIKNEKNVDNLKKSGVIVYLKTTPENIAYNLRNDNSRPLLMVEDKLAKIRELMQQRVPTYEKYADVTIDVSQLDLENTLINILREVERFEN